MVIAIIVVVRAPKPLFTSADSGDHAIRAQSFQVVIRNLILSEENRVICNNSNVTGPPGETNHQLQACFCKYSKPLIELTKSDIFGLYYGQRLQGPGPRPHH